MRTVRKLVLLCAMSLTAMALGASAASAQEVSIEVVKEPSGTHCNPCYIHFEGEAVITVNGILVSDCQEEWEAEIYEDGSGHVHDYIGIDHPDMTVGCTRQPCNGVGEPAAELQWPITNPGENAPNEAHVTVRVCLDTKANPNGTGAHCNLEIDIEEDENTHHYYPSTDTFCMGGPVRVVGVWEIESLGGNHDNIEIVHP